MARPTKLAAELATVAGESASRVQRWIEDGYGPAGAEIDAAEHFRRLAPLMGTGRDGDVAVLRMAADGYPCRRLRDVLAGLAGDDEALDADELVEHLMGDETVGDLRELWTEQARSIGAPSDLAAAGMPDEPGLPDLVVRTAALPIADAVAGHPVEMFDTAELNRMGGWEQLGMPALPFDESAARIDLDMLTFARETARRGEAWIATSSPDELARGVAAAGVIVEALAVMHPGVGAWSDEHRWRRIGFLAPIAQTVLAVAIACLDFAADVPLSPALRRYADALKGGRGLVPPAEVRQIPLVDRPDQA